jgi:hypothetical protein
MFVTRVIAPKSCRNENPFGNGLESISEP